MTRRPSPLLVAIGIVGIVGLVAGCSGGSDDSSGTGEVTTIITGTDPGTGTGTGTGTGDSATGATTGTATDGSAAPAAVTGADADPPGEVFTGDRESAWCDVARDLDDADTTFDEVDFTDPAAVEAAIGTMRRQLDRADDGAPDEIAADVQIVIDTFTALDAELAAVDYDFLDADLSVLDGAGTDSESASDRVASYNEQVCGIAAADDADSPAGSDFDPGAGTIRDQSISQLVALGFTSDEAACLFDGLDFTDPELATQYDTILAAFDACAIDPARLADLGAG